MSTEDRVEATAKNIEGHVKEAYGEIVGDPEQKMKGKAKQAEAQAEHSVENVKDEAKNALD